MVTQLVRQVGSFSKSYGSPLILNFATKYFWKKGYMTLTGFLIAYTLIIPSLIFILIVSIALLLEGDEG